MAFSCLLLAVAFRSAAKTSSLLSVVSSDSLMITHGQEVTTTLLPEYEPNHPSFFNYQLDLCRRIATEDANSSYSSGDRIYVSQKRQKFVEHSRCTARFGEVLWHAREYASTENEHVLAVYNAKSLIDYVEEKLVEKSNSLTVLNRLVDDVARCLSNRSLSKFRSLQLKSDASDSDFTLEQCDLELIGRLYYSAIRSVEPYLTEVGLSHDHMGITALLALCRASSCLDASSSISATNPCMPKLSESGARLDAALSNHFNGITVPGCRFFFSPHHGRNSRRPRAKQLIVAFSSLGNGIVRHEFGGSLSKLNKQMGRGNFDVLFVADPAQSWYLKDDKGTFAGFAQYESRIKAASKSYNRISLIGDSMGGSAALLFAHLATDSVVAFSPQVNLIGDDHVSRDDMTPMVKEMFQVRLFESVEKAVDKQVRIIVHRGLESSDIKHTDLLMNRLNSSKRDKLNLAVHSGCTHHQVAVHLKEKNQLLVALSKAI